ncbi:hypothetical protein Pelo_9078 [Pelomyxa schiedti]|nr:hypothetical protein Pelo_9078 [Pelomyxa schiedti]
MEPEYQYVLSVPTRHRKKGVIKMLMPYSEKLHHSAHGYIDDCKERNVDRKEERLTFMKFEEKEVMWKALEKCRSVRRYEELGDVDFAASLPKIWQDKCSLPIYVPSTPEDLARKAALPPPRVPQHVAQAPRGSRHGGPRRPAPPPQHRPRLDRDSDTTTSTTSTSTTTTTAAATASTSAFSSSWGCISTTTSHGGSSTADADSAAPSIGPPPCSPASSSTRSNNSNADADAAPPPKSSTSSTTSCENGPLISSRKGSGFISLSKYDNTPLPAAVSHDDGDDVAPPSGSYRHQPVAIKNHKVFDEQSQFIHDIGPADVHEEPDFGETHPAYVWSGKRFDVVTTLLFLFSEEFISWETPFEAEKEIKKEKRRIEKEKGRIEEEKGRDTEREDMLLAILTKHEGVPGAIPSRPTIPTTVGGTKTPILVPPKLVCAPPTPKSENEFRLERPDRTLLVGYRGQCIISSSPLT